MYELLESLGPAHPSRVSVTVAEATERERRGIPLAISGDPVPMGDSLEREWLRNNPGQPTPFDPDDQVLMDHADMQHQHKLLRSQPLRQDWVPVADETPAAPVVETEAAGSRVPAFPYVDTSMPGKPSARLNGQIILVKLDPTMGIDVALKQIDGGVELTLHHVGVSEQNVGRWSEHHADPATPRLFRCGSTEEHALTITQPLSNYPLDRRDNQVVSHESVLATEMVDDDASSHNSSPSVGAPGGALRDNSNPTEGDSIYWPRQSMRTTLAMWPAPSHQALTGSMAELAEQQRRLTIGGVLRVAPDRSAAGAAS